MILAAAAVLIAGCSSNNATKNTDNVLTIGTSYYISSLNPSWALKLKTAPAYSMLYPQLW